MNPERWQRVNEIFLQAVDCDPSDRAAVLERLCAGDAALKADVELLIAGHESADDSFLAPSSMNVRERVPSLKPQDAFVGATIGRYEVKKRIGGGGMGSVYLAVRAADYKQHVAIKVIKRGMDTEEVLRRFRTEVRVLAAVSRHPNVAALLDAGTTDDGLPYFVMEYVEGEQIDRYCDKHRLSVRERLRLFQDVCAAVQFAHQHTVVHRDIKPGNVLVTADGAPKLIDFGIAKLTTPELGAETAIPTATEFRVMTPEYASPEQARGDSITTASDVYSLGILLYELLCGRRPYRLKQRSQREIERIICREDPPKPSTTVSRTPDDQTAPDTRSLGDLRRLTPKSLKRLLSGDLDNIVMTAIRKEPQRRYSSVEKLSADIDRYLQDRPVTARRIGLGERLRRWCRRNPVPASLIAAVVLSAVFGIWHLSRLSQQLVRSAALEGAAQQAQMLEEVQDFYSDTVASRARKARIPVTHRYLEFDNALPVPATFTIDLGEHIARENQTGSFVRMYSDSPFKHRKDGGPRDEFETTAIGKLRANPDEPYYRFETYKGRLSLRYAKARVMAQSCVDCHNSHPDSARHDWKVGDVRGVLEIIRPLEADSARTREGLQGTFVAMGALSGGLLLTALVAVAMRRRREH